MSARSSVPLRYLPTSLRALSRYFFAMGLAGVIAGVLVGGIGGRIVMRGATLVSSIRGVRTEAGARVGEFTLEGTIEIVVFVGIFSGLFGAVFYAVTRPWLMWAGKWHGALFGIFLFAIGSATSDALNPDNRDFFLLDNNHLIVLMFFALFVLFGIAIAGLFSWLDRRLPRFDKAAPFIRVEYVVATALGLPLLFGVVRGLITRELCECDPPLVAGIAFFVLTFVTIATWVLGQSDRNSRTAAAFRLAGWTALGVATLAGAIRALSDISEIVSL
ncbi:MAG: hypothetical protein V3V29_07385 [Acidimicrobiia bacterium]